METETDNENVVPETTAASPDLGAPRLDADDLTQDVVDSIDNLLDEAERETAPQTNDNNSQNFDRNIEPSATETPAEGSNVFDASVAQPAPEPAAPQIQIDPEISAIEQPRNLSEKNQSNWRKLQETATLYKQQTEELQAAYQQALQQQQQVPQDYEELRQFRAIFDIKNDPTFISKYDQPITQAKGNIYEIMKNAGASPDLINEIEKRGGPDAIDQNWWKQHAIDQLPLAQAEMLKRNLVDIYDLKNKKEGEIAFAAQHAEEIVAQREQYQQAYEQEQHQTAYKYADELTIKNKADWARYQQIPAGASQEQIQKINAHNESVRGYEQKFFAALNPQSAEERAAVASAAVLSHKLVESFAQEQAIRMQLQAEYQRVQAELNRLKGASKMPRQSISTPSGNKNNSINDRIKMNASDAIDMGLDEAGA